MPSRDFSSLSSAVTTTGFEVFGEGQEEGIVDDRLRLECDLDGTRHQILGRVQYDGIQSKLLPEIAHAILR